MGTRQRWWQKANALASAMATLGFPTRAPSVAVLLAVAEHETSCGDAWPGEHNWGATTARPLHPDERAALTAAGISPTVGPSHVAVEAQARMALAAAVAAGTLPDPGPGVALHCDSAPTKGPYFVFFAAFPDDEAGAKYFAGFFRTPAEKGAIAGGDPGSLAAAMYAAGYFTGFHVPHALYELRAGRWVMLADGEAATGETRTGAQLNVEAYAADLRRILPGVLAALDGWSPGAEYEAGEQTAEPAAPLDPSTPAGLQRALNALGADPQLDVDGIVGPRTHAAILAFQRAQGLPYADGVARPETIAALQAALDAL